MNSAGNRIGWTILLSNTEHPGRLFTGPPAFSNLFFSKFRISSRIIATETVYACIAKGP